jgi:hypothetical protein
VAFDENYQQPVKKHHDEILFCTVAADSQVVKCNRFGHQQVIHILSAFARTSKKYLTESAQDLKKVLQLPDSLSQVSVA